MRGETALAHASVWQANFKQTGIRQGDSGSLPSFLNGAGRDNMFRPVFYLSSCWVWN
jgi:hypothetical protein